jgi:glycosyltransferase involved in cell wall biosynthesis
MHDTKLRIAQVAPLYESVPPKLYGGTERIVSFLTEALVEDGHEVTLYASGDSKTEARLVPVTPASLRLNKNAIDQIAPHITMLQMVQNDIKQYDIVHYHIDYLHYPISIRSSVPHVTTLHGLLEIPELQGLYNTYPDIPVISISDSQRKPLPQANWQGTVYHGLPEGIYTPTLASGNYLAFLGRTSPEKGLDNAIKIALGANIPLRIAAKVADVDQKYFESVIKPYFDNPLITFIGEIGEDEKCEFLGNAMALLFPIQWPEPFGVVMIEAMACGTPVIAYGYGSVREIISPAKNGFIVNTIEEAIHAVRNIHDINRQACHESFLQRFTARRMAADYVSLYEKLIQSKTQQVALKHFAS